VPPVHSDTLFNADSYWEEVKHVDEERFQWWEAKLTQVRAKRETQEKKEKKEISKK
jgi:hypothetical protein